MSKKSDEEKGEKGKKDDLERRVGRAVAKIEDDEPAGADEADEGDEEDEEEEEAAPAKPIESRRAKRPVADPHHDEEEADEATDEEDPAWWLPHAVLSALVVIGVLGFFGAFNGIANRLGVKHAPIAADPAPVEAAKTAVAAAPAPQPPQPNPNRPPQQQGPQAPMEMFAAKHLLVMYKGSMRAPETITRSKDEAKARAEEAAKKAKDPKNKFDELVKTYSDEPGAGARGGDLGTFPKGRMIPAFQEALDKLKIGQVSGVVETSFGFHVILRTEPAAPGQQPGMPPGHPGGPPPSPRAPAPPH